MDITIERAGSITIVTLGKRMDSDNAKEYENSLESLLKEGTRNLLVDFSKTEYIGSAGLRVLLIIAKNLKKSNGTFILCQIKPQVFQVFIAGGFNNIFKIFPSREEGMLHFLSPD